MKHTRRYNVNNIFNNWVKYPTLSATAEAAAVLSAVIESPSINYNYRKKNDFMFAKNLLNIAVQPFCVIESTITTSNNSGCVLDRFDNCNNTILQQYLF